MPPKTDVQSILNRAYSILNTLRAHVFHTFQGGGYETGDHAFRGYVNVDTWIVRADEALSGLLVASQTIASSWTE